ncbi:flagellar brake protein [endosymbiont of unidentified scaly snail isolate Monju]|uniref:flagellar brake protein n=1 Tax=endosymbiont of unidentified scaly snail isolate Monju TaxID=1248727 RepID=UPI0009DF5AB1|nr:flagellar brake protein [endosymbiont of unidentified scaly snail isolate Monju]
MSEDTLNLAIGAPMQIQPLVPDEAPRELVRVIGYLVGSSLVVTNPVTREGKYKIVREGQVFKVRMLRGDSVVGFTSRVLAAPVKPYPHLHLAWPREFEQIVVRNSARVRTRIACQVRNTRQPDQPEYFQQAEIADLSETGVRLQSRVPLGEVGDMVQILFNLEVLGQAEALNLVGDVRSRCERMLEEDGRRRLVHLHGIQFRAINRFQQVLLHAWVMEQLATGAGDLG